MTLPPQHVLLKRKRKAENPDVLCIYNSQYYLQFPLADSPTVIQTGGQSSKRPNTNTQCFFKRVPAEPSLIEQSQRSPSQTSKPHVVTNASDGIHEHEAENCEISPMENDNMVREEKSFMTSKFSGRGQILPTPNGLRPGSSKAEPRAFYLTRNSSSQLPRLSSLHGVHKSSNKSRKEKDLAVFAETQAARFSLQSLQSIDIPRTQLLEADVHMTLESQIPETNVDMILEPQILKTNGNTLRKRPNKSEAEAMWRQANWTRPISSTASIEDSSELEKNNLQLAEELQQYAIEETRKDFSKVHRDIQISPITILPFSTTKGLKFQPKPPPMRTSMTNPEPDQMITDPVTKSTSTQYQIDDDDDDDYVYDTYVRQIQPIAQTTPDGTLQIDDLMKMNVDSYGVLVITEEDSELWGAYGENDLSDKDWNSEEEDENGWSS